MSVRIVTPAVLLFATALLAAVLVYTRPEAQARPHARAPLLVSVLEAMPHEVQFNVTSRGRVTPRTETRMVSEVAGAVVEIAPQLVAGGMFAPDEVMLRIDPRQYQAALQQARAALARALSDLATEQARAGYAQSDYERLANLNATELPPSELVLRKPQLAAAAADVAAARAALARAEDDLDRTVARAPYQALVREKHADLGQYVSPGTPLVSLAATDHAEVRLPLTLADLEYLPINELDQLGARMAVTLHAPVAGREHSWQAQVVRSEGVIDPDSQVLHVVARIDDPYGRNRAAAANATNPTDVPLRFGTFVAADISGYAVANVISLPRHALLEGDRVWRLDSENRIEPIDVSVLRRAENVVHIGAGINPGDRICITPMANMEPGTPVRIRGAEGNQDLPDAAPRSRRRPF